MKHMPPGTSGLLLAVGVYLVTWYIVARRTPDGTFTFELKNEPKSFEPRLANYVRAVEYMLGLATGSIVLIAGSSALHRDGKLPWVYASPLVMLAVCVVYGLLFMGLMIYNYEEYLHHHNYTRKKYVRSQALGFSGLACFCLGYLWIVLGTIVALTA